MGLRVLVIGSGLQGAAAAAILSRDGDVDEVILGDIDYQLAKNVANKIGDAKVTPIKLDASRLEEVKNVGSKVDLIINMAPPRFNLTIMRAAAESSSFYVDTACGPDLDLNPIDVMVHRQIEMGKEFDEAGVAGLIACGYTPGLTDVVVSKLVEDMDIIYSIKIRVGSKVFNQTLEPPLTIIMNYSEILEPTWSPEVSFLYRASPPVVYKDGKFIRRELFGELEEYEFPPPVGRRWNVLVDHEEPILIPKYIEKEIRYVDYKNQPDLVAYSLIKLGFASSKPIKIGRMEVVPRDVILKMLRRPVNMFLEESEDLYSQDDLPYVHEVIVIDIKGECKGKTIFRRGVIRVDIPPSDPETRLKVYDRLGTLHFYVALPAIIGGKMAVKSGVTGVISPEKLNPDTFLNEIKGYEFNLKIDVENHYSLMD